MRGVFSCLFGVCGLVSFCLLMFFSNNLSFFWLFLELSTLCAIPMFFLGESSSILGGLYSYIIVSSISSSLMLCGILYEGLLFMLLIGLLIKFGLFPFWGWVYNVSLNSNWLVVWVLSTFLKLPVFFFPFFLGGSSYGVVSWVCCVTFLGLSILFWLFSFSWYHIWCHMMLSSSCSLVAMAFVVSFDVLFYLFLVYFFWCSMVVLFLSLNGSDSEDTLLGGVGYYFMFVSLLVSVPVSLSLFYKLIMSVGMFACNFVVLAFWVLYSLSEQFYLLKLIMGGSLPSKSLGVFSVL
uniref:NADH dehydrogenase subunit 2 n=1 Tax=Acanthoparyphium sp. WAK-2018 TaxID=2185117 RepID=A0A2S1YEI1_9TREM|nr:NADH dehydrogenase subunit 2 [Acanthoparyphium sp. WAK-2018]